MAPLQVQSQQVKFANGALTSTTNQATQAVQLWGANNAVQVVLVGSGSISVTAAVQVSIDGANWIQATSLTVSGTATATNGATLLSGWRYMRVNLTSITGTGATATVFVSGLGA